MEILNPKVLNLFSRDGALQFSLNHFLFLGLVAFPAVQTSVTMVKVCMDMLLLHVRSKKLYSKHKIETFKNDFRSGMALLQQ